MLHAPCFMIITMDQTTNFNTQQASPIKPKKHWYRRWWGMVLILFLLYFLVMTALLFLSPEETSDLNISSANSFTGQNKVKEEELYLHSENDPVFGNPEAKVRIVEFGDFQCPYCQQSFPIVREILGRYSNKIYFIYRDFPVSDVHDDAQKAAEAGQCANLQGKFWPLHDKIFINQENITVLDLKRYALELGIERPAFDDCLDSGQFASEVSEDYLDGIDLGVVGTPTFFINGYRISGSIPEEIFIQLIEAALRE